MIYRSKDTTCSTYHKCELHVLQALWDQHDGYPDLVQLADCMLRVDEHTQLDFPHRGDGILHRIFDPNTTDIWTGGLQPVNKIVYVVDIHTREDESRRVLAMCQYDGKYLMFFTLETL